MTLQYKQTHSGQKRAYGDNFDEYEVTSDLPIEEVVKLCCDQFKCTLSEAQWKSDHDKERTAGNYFRRHYTIRKIVKGLYKFSICYPYTG